jgi:hypothetical protein
MAVTSKQVSVGTSATEIFTADTDGNLIYLTMADSGNIHLGGAGVTTSTGMRIEHGGGGMQPLEIKLGAGEALYGVTGTGTEVVTVLVTNW